jgi:hypothetical protein
MQRAEAVDLLRRLHQAQQAFYAGGDEAPVRVLLTDDIHWHVPGHDAIAGDYQGSMRYWRTFVGVGTWWIAPSGCTLGDVLVGDGDRIAALTDGAESLPGLMPPLLLGCSIKEACALPRRPT